MTHITTTHSSDIPLTAPWFDYFGQLLKFFAAGIREMNRYLDAASHVHPVGRPEPKTSRERSWEGPL